MEEERRMKGGGGGGGGAEGADSREGGCWGAARISHANRKLQLSLHLRH